MRKKGDKVVIYGKVLAEEDEVGEAVLIERVDVKANTERWLVQFNGEARLEKRTIKRLFDPVEETPPKMVKRLHLGEIKYIYAQTRDQQAAGYGKEGYDFLKEFKKGRKK